MTESEIIKQAIEFLEGKYPSWGCDEDEYENAQIAIQALEEVQQYRAIGTVEECRTAVERMKPKKVIHKKGSCYALAKDGTREYEIIQECPNCQSIALKYSYPCRCGQAIDWSE